jgi:hypothetical protein
VLIARGYFRVLECFQRGFILHGAWLKILFWLRRPLFQSFGRLRFPQGVFLRLAKSLNEHFGIFPCSRIVFLTVTLLMETSWQQIAKYNEIELLLICLLNYATIYNWSIVSCPCLVPELVGNEFCHVV